MSSRRDQFLVVPFIAALSCAGCVLGRGRGSSFPEITAPRDPATNPLTSGAPLVANAPGSGLTCGGAQLEPEGLRVTVTAQELCVTKIKNDALTIDDRARNDDVRDGNAWRFASDSQRSALFQLTAQGAPKQLGWCTENRAARPEDVRAGRAQATAGGGLVAPTPVRVVQYRLKGCTPNNGVLVATSSELALRMRSANGHSEGDWVAWGFAAPPAPASATAAP